MFSGNHAYRRRPAGSGAGLLRTLLGLLVVIIVFMGPGAIAYRVAHPPREALASGPAALELEYRELTVPTPEGELPGWFLPASGSETTVILVHGNRHNRLEDGTALPLARALVEAGYNVMLFDRRGHGEAPPGSRSTFGAHEPDDLARVVAYVRNMDPAGRNVVLGGWGLGANIALRSAADHASHAPVEALVLDSPLLNPLVELERLIVQTSPYPEFFFSRYTRWLAEWMYGLGPEEFSPLHEIGRIAPTPVLLIQGDSAFEAGERLLHLSGRSGNELLVIAGASGQVYAADPRTYAAQLIQFLNRHTRTQGQPT